MELQHISATFTESVGIIINRWIGRRGPITWPARSPDLNPLDFNLWRHLKTNAYDTPAATVEVLRNCIIATSKKIRNTPGI